MDGAKFSPVRRLRALVDSCGLTRTDIAGRAGMTPGMLTRLLSGDRNPSIETVRRVLVAIGCGWSDLDPIVWRDGRPVPDRRQ